MALECLRPAGLEQVCHFDWHSGNFQSLLIGVGCKPGCPVRDHNLPTPFLQRPIHRVHKYGLESTGF